MVRAIDTCAAGQPLWPPAGQPLWPPAGQPLWPPAGACYCLAFVQGRRSHFTRRQLLLVLEVLAMHHLFTTLFPLHDTHNVLSLAIRLNLPLPSPLHCNASHNMESYPPDTLPSCRGCGRYCGLPGRLGECEVSGHCMCRSFRQLVCLHHQLI